MVGAAATAAAAWWQGWPLAWLLWVFWLQSVVIGAFNVARMAGGPDPRFDRGPRDAGPQMPPATMKGLLVLFFLAHFGLVHLVFLVLLLELAFGGGVEEAGLGQAFAVAPTWRDALLVLGLGGVQAWASWQELPAQRAADAGRSMDVVRRMFVPYLRVVPLLGLVGVGALVSQVAGLATGAWMVPLFVGLKLVADLATVASTRAPRP